MDAGAECKTPRQQRPSGMGHERRFRPVVQMPAYPLTAADQQTSPDRCLGPILLKESAVAAQRYQ